jgi:hypothetical protein
MSKKIIQIVDVVREAEKRHYPGADIRRIREEATHAVAERRGIGYTTVCDKYQRQLEPDAKGTDAFDILLEAWLVRKSPQLRNVLMAHASDRVDQSYIEDLFDRSASGQPAARQQSKRPRRPGENKLAATNKLGAPQPASPARVVVELEPDVPQFFPDSEAVNKALRGMLKIYMSAR